MLTPLSANALVLCEGLDGHSSVEKSVNGKCFDLVEQFQDSHSEELRSDSHCGTCVDTLLSSEVSTFKSNSAQNTEITNYKFAISIAYYFNSAFIKDFSLKNPKIRRSISYIQNDLNIKKSIVIQV